MLSILLALPYEPLTSPWEIYRLEIAKLSAFLAPKMTDHPEANRVDVWSKSPPYSGIWSHSCYSVA